LGRRHRPRSRPGQLRGRTAPPRPRSTTGAAPTVRVGLVRGPLRCVACVLGWGAPWMRRAPGRSVRWCSRVVLASTARGSMREPPCCRNSSLHPPTGARCRRGSSGCPTRGAGDDGVPRVRLRGDGDQVERDPGAADRFEDHERLLGGEQVGGGGGLGGDDDVADDRPVAARTASRQVATKCRSAAGLHRGRACPGPMRTRHGRRPCRRPERRSPAR